MAFNHRLRRKRGGYFLAPSLYFSFCCFDLLILYFSFFSFVLFVFPVLKGQTTPPHPPKIGSSPRIEKGLEKPRDFTNPCGEKSKNALNKV